jgi:hypothetical protein
MHREVRQVCNLRGGSEEILDFFSEHQADGTRITRAETPPPRSWWIQDWLGPHPTLCSGSGGIGKSLLWQTLGTALALGKEFIGATAKPLTVMMWACEDDGDEIWRRQAAICDHFDVGIEAVAGKLFVVPRFGESNTLFDLAYGRPEFTTEYLLLREEVNDLKADVLILDDNAQVFGGIEHDRHHVTMFVNGVHGMVRGRPFAPVLLGHVARTAGSEFSGSAAWENACRMRWYMGTTLPDNFVPPWRQSPRGFPDARMLSPRLRRCLDLVDTYFSGRIRGQSPRATRSARTNFLI